MSVSIRSYKLWLAVLLLLVGDFLLLIMMFNRTLNAPISWDFRIAELRNWEGDGQVVLKSATVTSYFSQADAAATSWWFRPVKLKALPVSQPSVMPYPTSTLDARGKVL